MATTGVNPDGTTRQRVDQLARQVFATPISPPGPPARPTPPGGSGCLSDGPSSRLPSMWSTASAHDGSRPGSDASSTQGRNLKREAETLLDWDCTCGAAGDGDVPADLLSLPTGLTQWPTPQANADAGSRNCEGSAAHAGTSLADAVTTGSSRTGRQGNTRRLNVRFVCWLMGFSPDWVDEISRVDGLRAMGNAVVPSCGAYAIAVLWQELRAATAADEGAA